MYRSNETTEDVSGTLKISFSNFELSVTSSHVCVLYNGQHIKADVQWTQNSDKK
jgi:hypothetical protein